VRAIIILICMLLAAIHTASAADFSVLSYNVFLRAPTWIFHDEHDWRTQHMPSFLSGYDAVVLQEAFSEQHRNALLIALETEYPYNSGILGEDEFLSFNGGVIILSRWPILKIDQVVFEGCDGSDCMVKKGVVYTAIEKQGERIHLFGLHLQAQKEYAQARVRQFPQLQRFILQQRIPQSELVLVAGDFNVDYFSNGTDHEFSQLTSMYSLVLPENSPAPSYDHASNTLVDEPVAERLDYIFYSGEHLVPLRASNEVLQFRQEKLDLSDHHPVAGHFTIGPLK
jgi:endonuclease/exonuclease/phosphatase family metal-dependent hydrolase